MNEDLFQSLVNIKKQFDTAIPAAAKKIAESPELLRSVVKHKRLPYLDAKDIGITKALHLFAQCHQGLIGTGFCAAQ